MPFLDIQKKLGISLDRHIMFLSAEQPYKNAARCHALETEWIECAHGIGATRAKKECKIEFEDFEECFLQYKTIRRMHDIKKQREKLMKEGKYTPPPHHSGKGNPGPEHSSWKPLFMLCFPLERMFKESSFIKYVKIKNYSILKKKIICPQHILSLQQRTLSR
uniref:NADH dehydrogenase [ubiquinone] iron-sulfur protein 5-like n=1 Tax=Arvicanthis niloticus TaxID=61156 RepID=UPI0014864AE6|nr:NADH dehydrogenase [ubiquinone] iron-sulfur protein 5-like [Arvicanthis niloticus]